MSQPSVKIFYNTHARFQIGPRALVQCSQNVAFQVSGKVRIVGRDFFLFGDLDGSDVVCSVERLPVNSNLVDPRWANQLEALQRYTLMPTMLRGCVVFFASRLDGRNQFQVSSTCTPSLPKT